VTPNWTMSLPGRPYDGDEPDAFAPRDEIVAFLDRYASAGALPVHEGVRVDRLGPAATDGGFVLATSAGRVRARRVVVCTGAFQRPHRPVLAAAFPPDVRVIDVGAYTDPDALPPGPVLVVGSGQTGCQLAEELHDAGRTVYLACGRAGWLPRRPNGRDIVAWLTDTTYFDATLDSLPSPAARLGANPQATGHAGGHDLTYRTLQAMGVRLIGRLAGVEDGRAHVADDLAESVAFGDAKYRDIRQLIRDQLGARAPDLPDPAPFRADTVRELDLRDLGAVILTAGFRPGYADWVDFNAFDPSGFPLTVDGASTVVPGLFFCGVHFLRTRKSSLMFGVGEDATVVAGAVAASLA